MRLAATYFAFLFALCLWLAPRPAAAGNLNLELNKMEDGPRGCLATVLIGNHLERTLDRFRLDLVLFNGKGVIFDDFHLHDAANDSDEVRVVLWLDIRRKMPAHLRLFDFIVMGIAHRLPVISKIQQNAQVSPS